MYIQTGIDVENLTDEIQNQYSVILTFLCLVVISQFVMALIYLILI